MNPNDNKNNKNNKPGGNWRGVASLVGWALLLTIIFSYASSVIGSTGRQASSINVEYGEFQEMVESGQVARVEFDNAEDILLITPEEGYSYTAEDGTVYTKTEDGYTYMDAAGQEQTAHLELFTVRIQSNDAVIDFLNEYGVEGVDKEYQAPVNPVLAMLVSYVLPFVLIFLMFSLVMRWMAKKGGMGGMGGIGGVGKANAKVYMEKSTGVTFKDVAGQDEAKESLTEIIDFLHNPQKYTEIGAKLPKGALLVGPPGTGKTLLARAVAGEANVQFLSISGSDFVELYVGIGASRVRDLFEQAKRSAPAIIFIDEIDAVGRRRGAGMGGGHDEREQTLNQLLVEMDGFGSNDGVIVMAATNRRDILDPALLRPGRFDRQIYVNVPDVGGREAILRVHARDKQLSDDVDLRTVARATAGFTGADLENLLNEAALISARKNLPVITMQTMEDAVLKVIAGPEKRSLVNIERDRRITAIHEAGHAVAAYFLPTQEPVHQITIVPRGNALGLTISLPDQDTLHTTRNEMRDRIVVLLGGRVAEQLEFDDISTGASNDLQRATKLAHDMIAKYGMNERIGAVAYDDDSEIFVGRDYERTRSYSEQTAAEIDAEVRKTVDQAYAHCTQILTEHHEKLQEIAQWLLEHETMSRSQFEACMQALPIPEKQEGLLAGEEKTDGAEED